MMPMQFFAVVTVGAVASQIHGLFSSKTDAQDYVSRLGPDSMEIREVSAMVEWA